MNIADRRLIGERSVLVPQDDTYPNPLREIPKPPKHLFVIGNVGALTEGLSIVGARKATPYGKSCATRFARAAAKRGITIISGGARGCDTFAHEAALEAGGCTVVFLGGGCDRVYPPENIGLFQRVIDNGGAVVSEQSWEFAPKPWTFRERNRLIAGLAKATLIVEAGLPSGTFSTADEALAANREVLVVPGSITSAQSLGANRLIYQGATPVVDDDTFYDQLFSIYGCSASQGTNDNRSNEASVRDPLLDAMQAQPMSVDEMIMFRASCQGRSWSVADAMTWIANHVSSGKIAQYPDGRYGPLA